MGLQEISPLRGTTEMMRSWLWWLGWVWLVSSVWAQPLSDGVFVLDDLMARWQTGVVLDTLSPTTVRLVRSGGVARVGGWLHPTERPARIVFTVQLPRVDSGDKLVVCAWAGVDDAARRDDPQNPHNGVSARLLVDNQLLAQVECRTSGWQPLSAELTSYAGKSVRLAFEIDSLGNTNYDWAYIAEAVVLRLRERFSVPARSPLPPEGVLEVRGTPGDRFTLNAPDHAPLRATLPENGAIWLRYAFAGARQATITELQAEASARVYTLQARLRLKSLNTRRAVYEPGEIAECVALIENRGHGTWAGRVQVRLLPIQDATLVEAPQSGELFLPPGAEHRFHFRLRVGARPRAAFLMRSERGSDGGVLSPVVAALPANVPDTGSFVRAFGEAWVLQNEQIRVVFAPASPRGYTARVYGRHGEGWLLLATTPTLAEAVLNAEKAPPKPAWFLPESVTPNGLQLSLVFQGAMGLVGRATLAYRLVGNRLECTARLTSAHEAHLYRFCFPDWRVGDGSFGERKDEALFPGLEYLLGDEPSSDTRWATPPYPMRVSPHPYKITVPIMAVRWRQWLVSLRWNPESGWSGVLRAPNALFAVPNRWEQGAHHRLALWVPTIPKWADENSEQAREPFRLIKGDSVSLSATLTVRSDAEDIIVAVADALREMGMPTPPAPQRTDLQALSLTVQGLLNSYDASAKAWRHTNTGPTFYDPQVALALWVLGHRLFPEEVRRRLALQQVQEAVSAQVRSAVGLELAFYIGGLPSVLDGLEATLEAVRKAQRSDGTWGWKPETPRHTVLGKAGDTSSGWTGERSAQVGTHARITLNSASQEALLRALHYLMRQQRPEEAQTWELPLHVPDLLAVPYGIHAFLDAYLINGDRRYLELAERWALRGVPFVYLWSAPDRPIMRGATIPVYGVTWLNQQPWFGVAVQWKGLVYARALYRLAQVTETHEFNWRQLADTITLCAVQQQEWVSERYPAQEGMYPDAFSVVKGVEEYHWNLNPRLLALCIAQRLRFEIEPRTLIVNHEGAPIACTAPGLQSAEIERTRLRLTLAPPVSGLPAVYLFVAGIKKTSTIRLNGELLPQLDDIDRYIWELSPLRAGWSVHRSGCIVRVPNPTDTLIVEIDL